MKRLLCFLLVFAMMLSLCACGADTKKEKEDEEDENGKTITYTVKVEDAEENPLKDVEVYVYKNDDLEDVMDFERTGSKGMATFSLEKSKKYVVVLEDVPTGYAVEDYYTFDGDTATITLWPCNTDPGKEEEDDGEEGASTEHSVTVSYEMDTPENVAAILNNGDIEITYHGELDEDYKDTAWPFIETTKLGQTCFQASNQGVDSSFAVIYADVTLKKGQILCVDYLVSSESESDLFVILVNGEDALTASGYSEETVWKTCYPVVAEEDGTYEVALFYLKDESGTAGDDTVYIKNFRIVG